MIHVVSSNDTPLAEIIGPRKNLHHQGLRAGDSVYGVSKNPLDAESLIARLGIETKAKLLGAARVSDQSRGRRKSSSDAAAGSSSELRLSIRQPLTSTWWRSWPTGSIVVWCTCSLHLARQQFCLSWLRASRCVLWVPCLQATLFKFLGSFLSSRCCWPMTVTVTAVPSIYVTARLHSGSLHLASRRVPEADLAQLHGRQESRVLSRLMTAMAEIRRRRARSRPSREATRNAASLSRAARRRPARRRVPRTTMTRRAATTARRAPAITCPTWRPA